MEGLQKLGANVSYHIPVRAKESHGITWKVLSRYLEQGFDLLLTCDTGIAEHDNLQRVRESGIPVIVTDHHTLKATLPPANAVINPQRLSADHPLRSLPGVGVAYQLMEALYKKCNRPFEPGPFQELAALGIVADVASVTNDTRYLLQKGLAALRQTSRPGLQTLYQNAGINPLRLDEEIIGFQIAPRLNAMGRLGDANPIVELLSTNDRGRSRVLATEVEATNNQRQFLTDQVEEAAEAQLKTNPALRQRSAIVLHHPDWPGGVVGIVANRLVERYQKPTILLTGKDPVHGSARSVEGINITEAITAQADLLIGFGGHPMAAGLSMPLKHLTTFINRLSKTISQMTEGLDLTPTLNIHHVLKLSEIDLALIDDLQRLAPFGPENPPLNFLIKNVKHVSDVVVGKTQSHRQVIIEDQAGDQMRFIWWHGAGEPIPEETFNLVCRLHENDYRGVRQISAEWIDGRVTDVEGKKKVQPQRKVFDVRAHQDGLTLIQKITHNLKMGLCWGEGPENHRMGGTSRCLLTPAQRLVILTSPPGLNVLEKALDVVNPEEIIVFAINPGLDTFDAFMVRLGGLTKYIMGHHEGRVSLCEITAGMAAQEKTLLAGLDLWQALGKCRYEKSGTDSLIIQPGESLKNEPKVLEGTRKRLLSLLQESRAFRRYFQTTPIQHLFPGTDYSVFRRKMPKWLHSNQDKA
jgi:single-stranded-DNA-specific exonuclease